MIPRPRTLVTAAVLALALAAPVGAYLKLGTRVGIEPRACAGGQFPIRYFITDRRAGVSAPQFQPRSRAPSPRGTRSRTPSYRRSSSASCGAAVVGDGANVIGFLSRLDRSHARRHVVHRRHDRRANPRVRHLLQLGLSLVRRRGGRGRIATTSSRSRCTKSGTCTASAHSVLGETELIGGGRRVIGAEAVMFPIAFTRAASRPHAPGRRHRRHLRHLRRRHVPRRHREHQRAGDQERQRRARRARRRLQPEDRQARRRLHADRRRRLRHRGLDPGPAHPARRAARRRRRRELLRRRFDVDVDFRVAFSERARGRAEGRRRGEESK